MTGVLSILITSTLLLSSIIPPFQSPDEFEHIKRAYLVTTGNVILKPLSTESTGGMVDTGLLGYMNEYEQYPFSPDRKISAESTQRAKKIAWSHLDRFSPVYNISSYFPGLYLPQSFGLYLGKKLDFSIADSYRLAKILAVLSAFGLIATSCLIFKPSAFILAILFTPMSLYQLASPSLDGVATATFILVLSIFSRITYERKVSCRWTAFLLGALIALLASSRIHAIPLLLLLFTSYIFTRDKKYLFSGLASGLFVAIWLYISIKTTVDRRVINTISSAEILDYYLHNIGTFFKLVFATLSNPEYFSFYVRSSLGNLGWADWPQGQFTKQIYALIVVCLALIAVLSTRITELKKMIGVRSLLVFCSASSVLIIFFALLIGWTTHPANFIEGVQGRYFHFPLLLIGYAICSPSSAKITLRVKLSYIALFFYALFMTYITFNTVLSRYYTG